MNGSRLPGLPRRHPVPRVFAAILLSAGWFCAAWQFAYSNCYDLVPAGRVATLVAFGIAIPMLPGFVALLGIGLAPQAILVPLLWKRRPVLAKALLALFCLSELIYATVVCLVFFLPTEP